jgi:hypothetical protein
MKRSPHAISLALTTLALLGMAYPCPSGAQQSTQDLVPFKATLTGPLPTIAGVVPVEPPMVFGSVSLVGEASFLGQARWVDLHTGQLGVDGIPKSQDGVGVMSGANNDAIFIRWRGLIRPTSTPGVFTGDLAYVVTGGRGRFLGATGSGLQTFVFDPVDKKAVTFSWDGMISRPKP